MDHRTLSSLPPPTRSGAPLAAAPAVVGGSSLGTHCLLDLYACQSDALDDPAELERLLRLAAREAGAQVLGVLHHRFSPHGVSLVCLLAESHISLHTWPEQGLAAADIYTCGDRCDPHRACDILIEVLQPRGKTLTTVGAERAPAKAERRNDIRHAPETHQSGIARRSARGIAPRTDRSPPSDESRGGADVAHLAAQSGCPGPRIAQVRLFHPGRGADLDAWLAQHPSLTGVERFTPELFCDPPAGSERLAHRPVVVGSGPAGLLAAYYLAARGFRPIVLERGDPVKERVGAIRRFDRGGELDPENNYLFGEGGAGTFSDGKLTCRLAGPDVDWVLERFVECGGKPSIRFEHRPHLGSNRLPLIVRNLRRRIEALGGEYRFRCRCELLDLDAGRVRGLHTSSGYIACSLVVLAVGHSARDTYEMLQRLEVPLVPKAFQLGLRIEQPQEQVNQHKYGRPHYLKLLGAADYTLVAKALPRCSRSACAPAGSSCPASRNLASSARTG